MKKSTQVSLSQDYVREVVGIFKQYNKLIETIDLLEENGINRDQISVLGNEQELLKVFHSKVVDPIKVRENPNTPKTSPVKYEEIGVGKGVIISSGLLVGAVGAFLAAGGIALPILGITVAIAGGGTGGAVAGAILAEILEKNFYEKTKQQIEAGGLLLWVALLPTTDEENVKSILKQQGAEDIHTYESVASQ